jgi:replicative DNA helicase
MPTPTALDHCRTILAAIIPSRRDLLDRALRHLVPTHFPDPTLRNLFVMLERYADSTGAILTSPALQDLLRGYDAGRAMLYGETFLELEGMKVQDSDFLWSLQQVREMSAERSTMEALTTGMQIVHTGISEGHKELKGHSDARTHILQAFADIDRSLSMQDSPEGDVRVESEEILSDYVSRKVARLSGKMQGILLGIPELDRCLGGLQPGELDLFVGYAGEGKTTLAVQTAWAASVVQGLNAVIMTTETLRAQVRRKLVARHSKLPIFDLPLGLDTKDLKNGTLVSEMETHLQTVTNDLTHNPSYGHLYVAQVPRGADIATIEAKLYRLSRMWHIDICVIDYLALLASERKRSDGRQELSDIVKAAKQMAATFDDGQGVTIVSPWQVNRTSYEEATKSGYYTLRALSDTAEAEKSADVVISLLGNTQSAGRYTELKCQILKNRDGERANSVVVDVDYATACISGKVQSTAMHELLEAS